VLMGAALSALLVKESAVLRGLRSTGVAGSRAESLSGAAHGLRSSALLRGKFGAGVARQSNNRLERSRGRG
jgi:hypothetical protein